MLLHEMKDKFQFIGKIYKNITKYKKILIRWAVMHHLGCILCSIIMGIYTEIEINWNMGNWGEILCLYWYCEMLE